MATTIQLTAQARTEFGKGAARRLRRANMVPAVVYTHGDAPTHIAIPAHDTMLALRHANALFSLLIDGKPQLAIAKEVQRDPIRPVIEHVDFLAVASGELVEVDVPVTLVGVPFSGSLPLIETQTIAVRAGADNLPSVLEVNVDGIKAGTIVTAAEVVLPEGVELVTDAGLPVVTVSGKSGKAEAEEGEE